MSAFIRFFWGGLGGLAPILATFLILEADIIGRYLNNLGDDGNMLTLVGYGVRVFGLFMVGGLWACLHKSEMDPKKLFQLGIVAPAMITGMISASNVNAEELAVQRIAAGSQSQVVAVAPQAPATATGRVPNSPRGIAGDRFSNREEPSTEPPPETPPIKSFIRGLLGRP